MLLVKAWWRRRALRDPGFTSEQWAAAVRVVSLLEDWPADALARLREHVVFFLRAKRFTAAGGGEITGELRLLVAIQACVPILHLDIDYYTGWREVIMYPDTFVTRHQEMDEAGVLHSWRQPSAGEAWSHGPLVLSQADVEESARYRDGYNVVIHEAAHKLDMLNGDANGFPPLHREMRIADWVRAWSEAYEIFCEQVDHDEATVLDPYGAENPAEFFAVISEAFFETPAVVYEHFPSLYPQLMNFYRYDPRRLV